MENVSGRQLAGRTNIDPSLSTARGTALSLLDKDKFVPTRKYCETFFKAATELELLNRQESNAALIKENRAAAASCLYCVCLFGMMISDEDETLIAPEMLNKILETQGVIPDDQAQDSHTAFTASEVVAIIETALKTLGKEACGYDANISITARANFIAGVRTLKINPEAAVTLLEQAHKGGVQNATEYLAILYADGVLVARDRNKALIYMREYASNSEGGAKGLLDLRSGLVKDYGHLVKKEKDLLLTTIITIGLLNDILLEDQNKTISELS